MIYTWRTRPYLATGWFWFLGTLVPVIGLVQVGLQSHADRYMYIPMVGLLVMLAWSVPHIEKVTAVAAVACLALAYQQTGYWQNSGTLFERAIDVTRDNYVAQYNLGNYLMNTRRGPEAIPHFEEALRLKPDYAEAHSNLGMVIGRHAGRACRRDPPFRGRHPPAS